VFKVLNAFISTLQQFFILQPFEGCRTAHKRRPQSGGGTLTLSDILQTRSVLHIWTPKLIVEKT